MLFRCSYTVRLRIDLKEGETLVLAEPAPGIRVTLQGLGERDVPETGTPIRQLCVVTEKIDDPGDDHPCASIFAQQAGGSFSSLPADCQAFIDVLIERLDDRARHCLSLLRWRYGIEGPQYARALQMPMHLEKAGRGTSRRPTGVTKSELEISDATET